MDLLQNLLTRMHRVGASDLLLSTETPPAFRVDGKRVPHSDDSLQAKPVEPMRKAVSSGMLTFDEGLFDLCQAGTFSTETAFEYVDSASNLRLRMKLSAHEAKTQNA